MKARQRVEKKVETKADKTVVLMAAKKAARKVLKLAVY